MNQKGLTLVEVLIAMGISTVVGALLVTIIVNSGGLFSKESSKFTQGLNINDALSKIRASIKEASSVAAAFTSGSTTYTSGVTQLVLKVPSQDFSNNIIINTFDYFVFFSDTNKLRFKTFPDPLSFRKAQDQIFSNLVDSLDFQYFNSAIPPLEVVPASASRVRVTLILKQKIGIGFEKNIATSEANLRND